MIKLPTIRAAVQIGLTLLGLVCIAKSAYMPAKAMTAQILMKRAWVKTQETGQIARPWSWMDAYPVARLHMPNQDTHIVLNEDSGQALAFGPALIKGTNLSGAGMTAIAAHKNTQFQSLKTMKVGDTIGVETMSANITNYRVSEFQIIDTRKQGLDIQDADTLALVTCYPFDAISFNGPMRYVAIAKKIDV